MIGVGGRRTRKKEEVEKRLRQALTEEAMSRLEKRARREKMPEGERGVLEVVKSKVGGEPREFFLPIACSNSNSNANTKHNC